MFLSRARAVPLLTALAFVLAALLATTASAAVTESNITAPSDLTYTLEDRSVAPTLITVAGTTVGAGNVDINCYTGSEYKELAEKVVVTGETFSTTISPNELSAPCVLRAVPEGDTTQYAPGTSSAFTGPRLAGSYFEFYFDTTSKENYGYEYEQNTLAAYNQIEPAGDCGLDYSSLYAPGSLIQSEKFFDCNGALFRRNYPAENRSDIQIDGQNAYDPYAANEVYEKVHPSNTPPSISVSKSFDSSTGEVTIHETDPIVKCSSNTFPPTESSCSSLISTGVQLERTWQTSHAGQVLNMTDVWHSTDGSSHSLNAIYEQYFVHPNSASGAFEFPGHSEFVQDTAGEAISLPSGSNAILYKEDESTPASGDLEHPQGAIVYDSPPNQGLEVTYATNASDYDGLGMHYQRTIPAGGQNTLRMAYVQAYSLSEVTSLATEAKSAYTAPSVSISSPANGTTVSTPTVTVTGTSSDAAGVESVSVNGQGASVSSSGTWTATVPLSVGSNTLTATVTNDAGQTSTASINVTYTPSSPPPPPPPHTSQIGTVSGANGKVTFGVACVGTAGTRCTIKVTLTTIEKLKGKHLRGVVARLRSKKVTLGTVTLSIPAGTRVRLSLKLNALGRKLLAHFGRLPVHLSVISTTAGTPARAVIAQNVIVHPVKKHKARKR